MLEIIKRKYPVNYYLWLTYPKKLEPKAHMLIEREIEKWQEK